MRRQSCPVAIQNFRVHSLYRKYNCQDHLNPYELSDVVINKNGIRLNIALDKFNAMVDANMPVDRIIDVRREICKNMCKDSRGDEYYQGSITPELILQKKLINSPETRSLAIELTSDDTSIYLCQSLVVELTEEVAEFKQATVLQVCCNYLRYLPYGVGQLKELRMLILSKNRLESIPEEVGLCKELSHVDLSNNLLTTLPRSFAGLKRLGTLHLTNNKFTELPSYMGKMPAMKHLHIGGNKLTNLPLEIFLSPFLLTLTVENNNLEFSSKYKEVGVMTLKEHIARDIIINNRMVPRNICEISKKYLFQVQECSFCSGPFFDYYIEVEDMHMFEGDAYPVKYKMCCKHYQSHCDRIQTLFSSLVASIPKKLAQYDMPPVSQLFNPYCFNDSQLNKMDLGFDGNSDKIPLISLARYNIPHRKDNKNII